MWQFNDMWPALSWSLVDAAGRRKDAWGGVRAAFWPRLLTIQPVGSRPHVLAVNDTDEHWAGWFDISLKNQNSELLHRYEDFPIQVPPRSASELVDIWNILGDTPRSGDFIVAHNYEEIAHWRIP